MTSFFVFCACAALFFFAVKILAPESAKLGGVFAAIVAGGAFVRAAGALISELRDFSFSYGTEYIRCITEVCGICIFAEICADICSECGNEPLAKTVCLYANAQVMLLLLPYLRQLLLSFSSFFSE